MVTEHNIILGEGFHVIIENNEVTLYKGRNKVSSISLEDADTPYEALIQIRGMLSQHLSEEGMEIYDRWVNKAKYEQDHPRATDKKVPSAFKTAPETYLTERELEVLDRMIEVQTNHRDTALQMSNQRMGVKQAAWDEERILLLKKLRYHSYDTLLERDKYKKAIIDCIEYANNRESEWGTRAEGAFKFLYKALNKEW